MTELVQVGIGLIILGIISTMAGYLASIISHQIELKRELKLKRDIENTLMDINDSMEIIKNNIHPIQFQLYESEIFDKVKEGWELSSADNTRIIFRKQGNGRQLLLTMDAPISVMQTHKFEALTYCGNCGAQDYHGVEIPESSPTHNDGTPNGSDWQVIRKCNYCQHKWGQE